MEIQTDKNYQFPNIDGFTFESPLIEVSPIVDNVDPDSLTISVRIYIAAEGSVNGKYAPNINPVAVQDLNYDAAELVQRIEARLVDFEV